MLTTEYGRILTQSRLNEGKAGISLEFFVGGEHMLSVFNLNAIILIKNFNNMPLQSVSILETEITSGKYHEALATCASFSSQIYDPHHSDSPHQNLEHKNRFELFEGQKKGAEISQRAHQRAISWVMTICQSKNLKQQCLLLTLGLYYACKTKITVKKQNLEIILLSCLSLALKMHQRKDSSLRNLAALAGKHITANDIVDMEAAILNIVDFDLTIPHHLEELYLSEDLEVEQKQKIMMICELMMVKDHSILVNQGKLERVKLMLNGKKMEGVDELRAQILNLLKLKQCGIILTKYSSKFDLNSFRELFQ